MLDLVRVTTRDGVRLDGTLQLPAEPSPRTSIDSAILVHGTGGSFYSSTLFDALAERFISTGAAVLRVNTRGHDLMSTAATAQGGRRLGAAYETVDDCRFDLAAWIDCLRGRDFARIALVGHSLGAVKCLYAAAREPHDSVARIIAVSPPRLSYSHFSAGSDREEFLRTYELARSHVDAGEPLALLDVQMPLPFVVAAAGYVEKYGPDERYNFLQFIERVDRPLLVTLGSLEVENQTAFRGLPELLEPIAARHGRMRVETVPGADHFYSRAQRELVERLDAWLHAK